MAFLDATAIASTFRSLVPSRRPIVPDRGLLAGLTVEAGSLRLPGEPRRPAVPRPRKKRNPFFQGPGRPQVELRPRRPIEEAADTRPLVPSAPGAIAGGPTEQEQEMGIFGFLKGIGSAAIGIAEGVTGIDIPFVGPGDRFFGGGGGGLPTLPPSVPGFGTRPLSVAGLPITGPARPADCGFGFVRDAIGRCVPGLGQSPGSDADALAGFGQPAVVNRATRLCGRGNVLDINGFCRDKRTIRNSDRMYPKGRRPLMTGGDLRCIATASRAAKRLQTQTKRLQKLGMLPKARRSK